MSQGEIMYKINNSSSYKIFYRNEKIMFWIYVAIICGLFAYDLLKVNKLPLNVNREEYENYIIHIYSQWIDSFIPFGFLLIILAILLCLMGKYHNYEKK